MAKNSGDLYRLAIGIFIHHSLTWAHALGARVSELVMQRPESFDHCVVAINKWVYILECLSIHCDPNGLAAADRTEQYVMWILTIRKKGCFTAFDNESNPHWKAAVCYMNMRHYQCIPQAYDVFGLWAFAAAGYDRAVRICGGLLHEIQPPTSKIERRAWVEKLKSLRKVKVSNGYIARLVQYCQLRMACSYVEELYENFAQLFGPSGEKIRMAMERKVHTIGRCIPMLESAVACEGEAGACADAALKGLWELAVAQIDRAVQLREAEPEEGPRYAALTTVPSYVLYSNATALKETCTALKPIIRDLRTLQQSSSLSALPKSWFADWERQYQEIIARVYAAPFVANAETATTACTMTARASIHWDIMRLAGRMGPEAQASIGRQQCIQRCLAEASKVDASLSSVHSLLAGCWRQAAQHMECAHRGYNRRAGAPGTATQEDVTHQDVSYHDVSYQDVSYHTACSLAYEQLADSWLTSAADYFRKAALSPTQQAAGLWREAAERTEAAARYRMAQLTADQPLSRTSQEWLHWEEYAGLPCVTACALAAACCGEASSVVGRRLQCLLQSVAFERALAGYIAENPEARAKEDKLIHALRKFLAEVALLVSTAELRELDRLPHFPEGHLLHLATQDSGELQTQRDLVDWLYSMLEQCVEVCVALLGEHLCNEAARMELLVGVRRTEQLRQYAFNSRAVPAGRKEPLSLAQVQELRVAVAGHLQTAQSLLAATTSV